MPSTIILSDNGASSGSAGLKQTAGNDGVLILQTTTSGGTATNALSISNTQAITVVNTGTGVTFSSSAGSGLRVYGASGTNQWDMYLNSTNLRFSDNTGGGRIVIDGTASVGTTFGVGGATPSASGSGITFPASQSASSDANTLDDYEEGSWSPVFIFGTTAQPVGGYQVARYVKIGKHVHVSGIFSIGVKSGATGNVFLGGLPFTVDASSSAYFPGFCFGIYSGVTLPSGTTILGEIQNNTTQALMFSANGSSVSVLTQTAVSNSAYIEFSFAYVANA